MWFGFASDLRSRDSKPLYSVNKFHCQLSVNSRILSIQIKKSKSPTEFDHLVSLILTIYLNLVLFSTKNPILIRGFVTVTWWLYQISLRSLLSYWNIRFLLEKRTVGDSNVVQPTWLESNIDVEDDVGDLFQFFFNANCTHFNLIEVIKPKTNILSESYSKIPNSCIPFFYRYFPKSCYWPSKLDVFICTNQQSGQSRSGFKALSHVITIKQVFNDPPQKISLATKL